MTNINSRPANGKFATDVTFVWFFFTFVVTNSCLLISYLNLFNIYNIYILYKKIMNLKYSIFDQAYAILYADIQCNLIEIFLGKI